MLLHRTKKAKPKDFDYWDMNEQGLNAPWRRACSLMATNTLNFPTEPPQVEEQTRWLLRVKGIELYFISDNSNLFAMTDEKRRHQRKPIKERVDLFFRYKDKNNWLCRK